MDICLSHNSALEFLRGSGASLRTRPQESNLSGGTPSFFSTRGINEVFVDDLRRWGISSAPLHAFASEKAHRSKSPLVCSHVWRGPYPQNAFVRIEQGLYSSSPELLFLCMGRKLNVIELAELGFELCGWYGLPNSGDAPFGMASRNPLSSAEAISRFLRQNSSIPGSGRAEYAARHLIDGSASPMESKMALACVLPHNLGGYALPKPRLNHRIVLDSGSAFRVDAFWPKANIGLEYDSRQFHTGEDRNIRDSRKRNMLASAGVEIISVTPPELRDPLLFEGIARRVACALGSRMRIRTQDYPDRRIALWRTLFGRP